MNTGETVKTKEGPLQEPIMMLCPELLSVINSTVFGVLKKMSPMDLTFLWDRQQANTGMLQLVTTSTNKDKATAASTRKVKSLANKPNPLQNHMKYIPSNLTIFQMTVRRVFGPSHRSKRIQKTQDSGDYRTHTSLRGWTRRSNRGTGNAALAIFTPTHQSGKPSPETAGDVCAVPSGPLSCFPTIRSIRY